MEIDQEIFSTVIFLFSLIQEGLLSVTSKGVCTELVKLVQEKVCD